MTKKIILDGGVELLYNHCSANNATEVYCGLKTGSYDNGNKPGLAHLFEHMLFKGTKNKTAEELNKILHADFRSMNAFTGSKNVIVKFYESNRRLEEGMKLVSEMLFESTFPAEELEREKNVIKQEIALQADRDVRVLSDKMFYETCDGKKISKTENYALGRVEDLDKYTREDLLEFKRQNMCSNNFIIAVSTKLSLFKIKRLAEKYFVKKLAVNDKLKSVDYKNIGFKGKSQNFVIKRDREKVFVILSKKNALKVSNPREDVVAGCLYGILNGLGSKFLNRLREKEGLVYSASMGVSRNHVNGEFYVELSTTNDKIKDCIRAVQEICVDLLKNGISKEEFDKMKENYLMKKDFYISIPKGKCDAMLSIYKKYGKWITNAEDKKYIKTLTYDEVNNFFYSALCTDTDIWLGAIGKVEEKDVFSNAELKKMFDFRKYAKK